MTHHIFVFWNSLLNAASWLKIKAEICTRLKASFHYATLLFTVKFLSNQLCLLT